MSRQYCPWVLIVDKVVNEQPCMQVLHLFLRYNFIQIQDDERPTQ